MKKNLTVLELSIPTLDLQTCKQLMGGDGYLNSGTQDDDIAYSIDLPEIIVTPSDGGNSDDNNPNDNWNDDFMNDDQDYWDDRDNDNNDGNVNDPIINISSAIEYLREHASSHSTGYCAKAIRQALEAGHFDTTGHPSSAKDYDTYLQKNGFNEVSKDGYVPQVGDIVVHEAQDGHPYGHIAMYDGENWISDFVQIDMFGSSAYRNNPNYSIWRP